MEVIIKELSNVTKIFHENIENEIQVVASTQNEWTGKHKWLTSVKSKLEKQQKILDKPIDNEENILKENIKRFIELVESRGCYIIR